MKKRAYLLPFYFKRIAALILLLTFVSKWIFPGQLPAWAILLGNGISLLMFIFSAQKVEDEYTQECRSRATRWALWATLLFILGAVIYSRIWDGAMPSIVMVMPVLIGVYILKFYYELYWKHGEWKF